MREPAAVIQPRSKRCPGAADAPLARETQVASFSTRAM